MNILIKGMEMPSGCRRCKLKYWDGEEEVCPFVGDIASIGRHDHCPLGEVPPQWIPVTERLPEDRHSVLVYCPHNKCIYTAYYENFNDEWYYFGCGGRIEVYFAVTHWMPLPEPPKEE